MKKYHVLLIFLASLMALQCAKGGKPFSFNFNTSRPKVMFWFPTSFSTNINPNTPISLYFSKKMDCESTNNAFSLTSSSGAINGFFSWDPGMKLMVFKPSEALRDSVMYTITLTTAAEDADGNDLLTKFESVFYINNDIQPPTVVNYTPPNNAVNVAANSNIVITFSEAIDLDTIYNGISISPSVQWMYTSNPTRTVITFDPTYNLTIGSTYTITIAGSVTDQNGNPLANPLSFTFTIGNDFLHPAITAVTSNDWTGAPMTWDENVIPFHNVEKDEPITITFSEPINVASLNQAISLNPSCPFYYTMAGGNTQAIINFTEPMESETNYTLHIASTVTDVSNNPLDRNYIYHFITDGEHSRRPAIVSVSDPITGVWPPNSVITLQEYNEVGPPPWIRSDMITITFNRAMNPTAFMLSATKEVGTGGTPGIIDQQWNAGNTVFTFRLRDIVNLGIYRLTIEGGDGGSEDQYGNHMLEDYTRIIEF